MDRREFVLGTAAIWTAKRRSSRFSTIESISVGDSRLRVWLENTRSGLREVRYEVDGVSFGELSGVPWTALLGGSEISPSHSPARVIRPKHDNAAVFEGEGDGYRWRVEYALSGLGRVTKTLALMPESRTRLSRVALWHATSPAVPRVVRTKIQAIAAFYRFERRGLFVSLDFPWSSIITEARLAQVSYPPHDSLESNKWYRCHSLTLGAIHLTGTERSGSDEGEIEAIDSYIQAHRPPRFERPMYVYASIINRYTQPKDDVVFYTMKNQPLFSPDTTLVNRDFTLMKQLGMEYYQLFPGVFEWTPQDPTPAAVEKVASLAHKKGLCLGDYSATTQVFSPHFNIHQNTLDHPEWATFDKDGTPRRKSFCFGNPKFVEYYKMTVAANCKRFGFDLHCLDLLKLVPCYASDHGHPPGEESLYSQVRGLMMVIEAINAVSPEMMTWPNSGDWQEILPKLAWYSPNLYLTDPFIKTPWQGLNMTRLLDDARREQMVSLHNSRYLPYRFFTNCQYFFSQNSVVPDIRNFQYGALSTLAVTPNLCLAEFRPWLDSLSPTDAEYVKAFYDRWTSFLNRNYKLWKRTFQAGEESGVGSVEIYSHAAGNHGYVFLINPHYWDRVVEVPLDATLGFAESGAVELVELFPVERMRLTAQGPFARLGSKLPVHVPAQQVLVLEIRPAPDNVREPTLYGVPGRIESTGSGYRVITAGPQGETHRIAVLLPRQSAMITSVRVDEPVLADPRLRAPTPIKLLGSGAEGSLLEVTFRRVKAPTELRQWRALPGKLSSGLAAGWPKLLPDGEVLEFPLFINIANEMLKMPLTTSQADELGLGVLANFCGCYVENAFSELQNTVIELNTGSRILLPPEIPFTTSDAAPNVRQLHPLARSSEQNWWLQTKVHLPFMYTSGAEPAPSEHTLLVIPTIRQERLNQIDAWVNGVSLKVERYAYPRNRHLSCYYCDLVGTGASGGDNQLTIYIQG